jgi:hypothetical protein
LIFGLFWKLNIDKLGLIGCFLSIRFKWAMSHRE